LEKEFLKALPSVEILVSSPECQELEATFGRQEVIAALRKVLDETREAYMAESPAEPPSRETISKQLLQSASRYLTQRFAPSLRKAINGTGVILHTGLGRAVLSKAAAESLQNVIEGYCTLATDIETGRRGHRDRHLNRLICELTGAEAAVVVNNNAAATMLILNTMANGKEVIVSRGQLVEIGGSFRMPDVMRTSGARLRDVGCTNKTHLRDYAGAISEETGAIMRVHHSNYRILGFASEPDVGALTELAHAHGVPMIDDIGSGALIDLTPFGISPEPLVRDSIQCGADLVCFSGDKLIGGPQAGIIVGKAKYVEKIGKNPLMRAFRVGKMTIAAMEATLKLFLRPETITSTHPLYQALSLKPAQLGRRARKIMRALEPHCPKAVCLKVIDGRSQVGSGSAPVEAIPTKLLSVRPAAVTAAELGKRLRRGKPPLFTRVKQDTVLLDLRTIQSGDDGQVIAILRRLLK
jgi:L-seryl-tRNA(Ser) seleniumtransferase